MINGRRRMYDFETVSESRKDKAMTDIVNLNKVRKAKQKQVKKLQAEQNRVVYGLSSKLRSLEKDKQAKIERVWSENLLQRGEDNKKVDESE